MFVVFSNLTEQIHITTLDNEAEFIKKMSKYPDVDLNNREDWHRSVVNDLGITIACKTPQMIIVE